MKNGDCPHFPRSFGLGQVSLQVHCAVKDPEDDDGGTRLDSIDDAEVTVEDDPDGVAGPSSILEAAFGKPLERFGESVKAVDGFESCSGVAFGDVFADLSEPVSGLLGPPYFAQEAILRPISW